MVKKEEIKTWIQSTKENVAHVVRENTNMKTISGLVLSLFGLIFLGTDGLHNILTVCIHTFGLMNPIMNTYKIVSQGDRTKQYNGHNAQDAQAYLKFWIVYMVGWFFSRMVIPLLNLFMPAQLLFNIFFICLLGRPTQIGTFVYDRLLARILDANVTTADRIMLKADKVANGMWEQTTQMIPNAFVGFADAVKPYLDHEDITDSRKIEDSPTQTEYVTAEVADDDGRSDETLFGEHRQQKSHDRHKSKHYVHDEQSNEYKKQKHNEYDNEVETETHEQQRNKPKHHENSSFEHNKHGKKHHTEIIHMEESKIDVE